MTRRSPTRPVPLVVFLGFGLSSCQLVFGEYHSGHAAAGRAGVGGTAGAGTLSGGTPSTAGTSSNDCTGTPPYRCQDVALQACDAGTWTTIATCTRAGLCQPTLGVCDVCADGDRSCSGSGGSGGGGSKVLSVCNTDHTAFVPKATCTAPLYCDVGVDYCVACAAKETRCNGNYLDQCNSARTGWDLRAQSCGTFTCHVVDGKSDYCNVCSNSDPQACSSPNTMRSCVSGKWVATDCPNGCSGTAPNVICV
jgi:hypothetical protein